MMIYCRQQQQRQRRQRQRRRSSSSSSSSFLLFLICLFYTTTNNIQQQQQQQSSSSTSTTSLLVAMAQGQEEQQQEPLVEQQEPLGEQQQQLGQQQQQLGQEQEEIKEIEIEEEIEDDNNNKGESPSIQIPQFTKNINFRQDVCDRHYSYARGEITLKDSLKGLQLNLIIRITQFFNLTTDNKIKNDDFMVIILDELGKRAGFTWRNSFAIAERPEYNNKTFTDLLVWGTETYDIFCGWWDHSLERLQQGIAFPEGLIEGNYILIGRKDFGKQQQQSSSSIQHDLVWGLAIWNWLEPFEKEVWWSITFTIIASGLLYMLMDYLDLNADERKLRKGHMLRWTPCYLSFLTFTQHFQFVPRSHSTRILAISLAFWSLLVCATYTANLASFFVINNTPTYIIQDIDEAVQANYLLCVYKGTSIDNYITNKYPKASLLRLNTEEETYIALQNNDCDLIAGQYPAWRQVEKDRILNSNCNLVWIGRVFKFVPAGFATISDAGTYCTSHIRDVLNYFLVEMKQDGFVDIQYEEHLRKQASLDCTVESRKKKKNNNNTTTTTNDIENENENNPRLGIKEMAGTFIIHWFLAILSFLLCLITRIYDQRYANNNDYNNQGIHTNRLGRFVSLPNPAAFFPSTGLSTSSRFSNSSKGDDDDNVGSSNILNTVDHDITNSSRTTDNNDNDTLGQLQNDILGRRHRLLQRNISGISVGGRRNSSINDLRISTRSSIGGSLLHGSTIDENSTRISHIDMTGGPITISSPTSPTNKRFSTGTQTATGTNTNTNTLPITTTDNNNNTNTNTSTRSSLFESFRRFGGGTSTRNTNTNNNTRNNSIRNSIGIESFPNYNTTNTNNINNSRTSTMTGIEYDEYITNPTIRNSMLDPSRTLLSHGKSNSPLDTLWRSHTIQTEQQQVLAENQYTMYENQTELTLNQQHLISLLHDTTKQQLKQGKQIDQILKLLQKQSQKQSQSQSNNMKEE